jgi:hypothetical protein
MFLCYLAWHLASKTQHGDLLSDPNRRASSNSQKAQKHETIPTCYTVTITAFLQSLTMYPQSI